MKHKFVHHLFALTILLLLSVGLMSSWRPTELEDHLIFYIVISIASLALGYIRPFVPFWLRWLSLAVIFVTICMVTDGGDLGLVWLAIDQCLFAMAITFRRIAMDQSGDTRTAARSVFRALYDLMDGKYLIVSQKVDEILKRDSAISLLPVAHAVSILSLSVIFLVIMLAGTDSSIEEYGILLLPGLAVLITFFYALKATCKSNGIIKQFLSAFIMFFVGFVSMIVCSLFVIFAFMAVNSAISAISKLLRKIFG